MRVITFLGAILAGSLAVVAMAQTPGDPRVGAILKEIGVEACKINDDGDYSCGITTTDTRSQIVVISSKPMKIGGIESRKLLAVAYVSDGPLSTAEASALLAENSKYNFGAWETQPAGDQTVVVFASHIDMNASAAKFAEIFSLVAVAADQTEAAKTGKDDY